MDSKLAETQKRENKKVKSEVEYSVLFQPEITVMKSATTYLGITVVKCISSIQLHTRYFDILYNNICMALS